MNKAKNSLNQSRSTYGGPALQQMIVAKYPIKMGALNY